jgi:integrase
LTALDRKIAAIKSGERSADTPATFHLLCDEFERERLIEAKYDADGFKVRGYRVVGQYRSQLDTIREYFPPGVAIDGITAAEIENFATWLSDVPVTFAHRRFLRDDAGNVIEGDDGKPEHERAISMKRDGTPRTRVRSSASVRRHLALLSAVFTFATKKRYLLRTAHPFHGVELPAAFSKEAERTKVRVLSSREEQALLAACDVTDRQHIKPVLIALIDTGRRVGEVLQWRWRNIDFDACTITVERSTTKTRRIDVIPFGTRLARTLESIRPPNLVAAADAFVFTYLPRGAKRARPLRGIKRAFASACKAAKLTGITIHSLRHTHGSRLHAQGVPLKVIQQRLGHTRLETTSRFYVNADSEQQQRAVTATDTFTAEVDGLGKPN